jgi:fused signal recognition particle receptor
VLSLLKKFREGLAKTVSAISSKTHGLFGGRRIDASSLESLEEALYAADFGVETTAEILEEIKAAVKKDSELGGRRAAEIGAEVLRRALAGSEGRITRAPAGPTVIVLIGVNGSGKTTTAAKLAWRLKQEGGTVILAACDTFRAAAIDQLKSWATRLDLELV